MVDNAATLFESTDKQSNDHNERIAQLEQLVGRLTIALDIQKKPRLGLELSRSQKQLDGRGVADRLLRFDRFVMSLGCIGAVSIINRKQILLNNSYEMR